MNNSNKATLESLIRSGNTSKIYDILNRETDKNKCRQILSLVENILSSLEEKENINETIITEFRNIIANFTDETEQYDDDITFVVWFENELESMSELYFKRLDECHRSLDEKGYKIAEQYTPYDMMISKYGKEMYEKYMDLISA